jgi:subtilisin family serine protease
MKRILVFITALVLAGVAFASEAVEESTTVNEFIVKAPDTQALEAFVADNGLNIGPLITYPNPSEEVLELFGCYYIVTFPEKLQDVQDSLVDEMEALDGVQWIEPNAVRELEPEPEDEGGSYFFMPDSFHEPYTPNDPLYPQQWGPVKTETDWAWNVSTGEGVVIAIIDSGVDTDHEDLMDNLAGGWNIKDNNDNLSDFKGHGTHVTGIVGATINNEKGVAGIAGNSSIMTVKINSSDIDQEVNGILYAADNGANIINLSIGGEGSWQPEEDAVNYAWSEGLFISAGCGNSNKDASNIYPASYEQVLSVGATTSQDARWANSNYGSSVNIFAPGRRVLSTLEDGGYTAEYSGTSLATPHIAGLAALIWSAHPGWTNQQVWDKIIQSADTITIDKGKVLRMNARKALDVEKIESIAEQPTQTRGLNPLSVSTIGREIILSYSVPAPTPYTLSIYDVTGREVADQSGQLAGSGEITYNSMSMSEGVYFWRFVTECGECSGKFVWVR